MPKSTALADRVVDMLAAISTAAEALFKHTTKAISVRGKANRTTILSREATTPDSSRRALFAHPVPATQIHGTAPVARQD